MPCPPSELTLEARRLHAEEGLGYKRIAKRLGISRDSARRRVDVERTRRLRRRRDVHACPGCGGTYWPKNGALGCRRCQGAERDAIDQRVIALWAAGETMAAIAERVGTSEDALGVRMVKIRQRLGVDALPYRRQPSDPVGSSS